jgi:hypothetical protein
MPSINNNFKPLNQIREDFNHVPYTRETFQSDLKAKHGMVGRHVIWLNAERQGWRKLGAQLIKIAEVSLLSISIVGLILVHKGAMISNKLEGYRRFELLPSSHLSSQMPIFDTVRMKTPTASFNHVNYYAIANNKLWFKPIDKPEETWKEFYFDGLSEGKSSDHTIPMSLSVDGANLVVIDNHHKVHYKKILKEAKRTIPIDASSNDIIPDYACCDVTEKDNWKDKWFSLPIVSKIVNLFSGKRLTISSDREQYIISHRGQFNRYYTDRAGKQHPIEAGVTTLYSMKKPEKKSGGKKDIDFADPWLPFGFSSIIFNKNIELPPRFVPLVYDASASTLFIIGNEETNRSSLVDGSTLKMYTKLADFDTTGRNPFLTYTNDPNKAISDRVRYTCPENWEEQPALPGVQRDSQYAVQITIFQTGAGNDARTLRVAGFDCDPTTGYWEKGISERQESDWKFFPQSIPRENFA